MSALVGFIEAAASYFGVPLDQVVDGSTVDASKGDLDVVLRIALKPDDVVGIAGRMKAMAEQRDLEQSRVALAATAPEPVAPSNDQLRAQYNSLPAHQRSAFGSFAKFKAAAEQAGAEEPVGERKEGGLDLPPHVWLDASECTEQQKVFAVGYDHTKGQYAIDPDDLTNEQRAQRMGGAIDDGMDRQ